MAEIRIMAKDTHYSLFADEYLAFSVVLTVSHS